MFQRRVIPAVALLLSGHATAHADSPWLAGIHWYGDPAVCTVETMSAGRGIWSLEIVQTDSDLWWTAAWQRDNRFNTMLQRGHSLIVRIERNWGETVPFSPNTADYIADVQSAAAQLASTCHIWQIGNEMNLHAEWGGNVLTPAQYVDLYRQARTAIRSVDSPLGPQRVLVGPASPGGAIPGVRHTDGNAYLAAICDLLAPHEVDGFALHAYAAPWHDTATSCREFQGGYLSQLAILDAKGFASKPIYITEWNRRVEPIDVPSEAASAQFLSGALADLNAWNMTPGSHPVAAACWFIFAADTGTWASYSIDHLRTIGPGGSDNDLWAAMQSALAQNYPSITPTPGASPRLTNGVPTGQNIASRAIATTTSSGNGALAIDGVVSVASKWTSDGSPPIHWLQLDFARERRVTGYAIKHAGAAGESAALNTESFVLQTADAEGGWRVDALVYNGSGATSTSLRYVDATPVQSVRLIIADAGIDNFARIPEFEIWALRLAGDFDNDGDIDGSDLQAFAFCMRGPDIDYAGGNFCRTGGDADGDADVDLADFAAMQHEQR